MRDIQTHNAHPSELTDRIKAFRARFKAHRHVGFQANADGVEVLIGELDDILNQANALASEISAAGWNRLGQPDIDPNSNVVLLRRGPTRLPGDGDAA